MAFPTEAFVPSGLEVQVDQPAGSGGGFTTIAEVKKGGFSGGKVDTHDATNMDSVGAHREVIIGLIDPGEFDLDGNYLGNADATQAALNDILESRVLANWKVILPTPPNESVSRGTWSFKAYVTQYDPEFPVDNISAFKAKLKITGPRTFTP